MQIRGKKILGTGKDWETFSEGQPAGRSEEQWGGSCDWSGMSKEERIGDVVRWAAGTSLCLGAHGSKQGVWILF